MILAVEVDAGKIEDWSSFHSVFAEAFGFPDFYGRNLDAWIDCMSRLDDDDFNRVHVAEGDLIFLDLQNANALKTAAPEILYALLEMAAFVNHRRVEIGLPAILILSCYA